MARFKPLHILFILALAGLVACVKDPKDIPSGGVIDDPVFRLEGTFDGSPVVIEAGHNLWTAVPLTTMKNSSIVYSSTFSIDGCIGQCTPSWTFNIYQALPSAPGGIVAFQNTVHSGDLEYIPSDDERIAYDIQVATDPNLFSYAWHSFWEDLNNPLDTFGNVFQSTVPYGDLLNLCFHSYSIQGCQTNQCITYDPRTQVPCTGYIVTQWESNRHLSLTLRLEGTPPFKVNWMNGEITQSTVIYIQDSLATAFADVTVTDANSNSIQIEQTVLVQNGLVDACYFPIAISSEPVIDDSPALFAGGFEIIYMDAAGNEWRSSAAPQPDESFAAIGSFDYYGLSPHGEEAYKANISLQLLLTNPVTGESKLFEADELTVPFSYKQ